MSSTEKETSECEEHGVRACQDCEIVQLRAEVARLKEDSKRLTKALTNIRAITAHSGGYVTSLTIDAIKVQVARGLNPELAAATE